MKRLFTIYNSMFIFFFRGFNQDPKTGVMYKHCKSVFMNVIPGVFDAPWSMQYICLRNLFKTTFKINPIFGAERSNHFTPNKTCLHSKMLSWRSFLNASIHWTYWFVPARSCAFECLAFCRVKLLRESLSHVLTRARKGQLPIMGAAKWCNWYLRVNWWPLWRAMVGSA